MDEFVIREMVQSGLSQRKMADKLGVSQSTIKYWLGKFGINTKKQEEYLCQYCGEANAKLFALRHGKPCRTICKSCDSKRAVDRARLNKQLALEYKGGCCSVCGYNKNPAALSFHHVDPKEKDLNFPKMKFWCFDRIKKELDKCVLVCLNCHAEIHNPNKE